MSFRGLTFEKSLKAFSTERKADQEQRLYRAVAKLAALAGEDADDTVDWLCGDYGGMAKLFEAYFAPKGANQTTEFCPMCEGKPAPRQPLTDDEFISMVDSNGIRVDPEMAFTIKELVEAAHGIKGEA
jgi:hypothetical protein